jgi:predicted dehydrogenase
MRIGVIGLGFMGATHLKAIKNIPGVELAAVSSDDPRTLSGDLSGVGGNLGGSSDVYDFSNVQRFSDAFAAVRAEGVDAVDLCLPTALHAPVAIEALKHGKHVLVEKPMALTGADCDAMIAAAKAAGKALMAAQVLRFIPAYLPLVDAVRGGRFGRIHSAIFRRRCAAPGWSAWMGDAKISGGGVFDLLIHDIDMMLHLFGLPDSVRAWGHQNLAGGVDLLTAQFEYPALGSVMVTGGWHHQKSYPFSMEYTVVGEQGVMEYSSAGHDPRWYPAGGGEEPLLLAEKDGYQAEIEYFVKCCRAGKTPAACSPESSSAAVKVTLTAMAARARKGESVPCQI